MHWSVARGVLAKAEFGEPITAWLLKEDTLQFSASKPVSAPGQAAPVEVTDEQAVARLRAGDQGYFELLMRRHNRRVYRAARAILKRDDEAEDVMQDAYVRAYEHLADFRGDASFGTWVARIAVHEALARVRREQRFRPPAPAIEEANEVLPEPKRNPEQLVNDQELRAVLEKAIDALPDDFRAVFVLRAVEQMSGAETAECLGIPEETVKTRLHRAKHRLQDLVVRSMDANWEHTHEFHLSRCDRVVTGVLARVGPLAGTSG
jgi:RNA polymerase sigma-70 factor (ECF subfamily)